MSANSILLHFCKCNAFDKNAKNVVKKIVEKYFGGLDIVCEKPLEGSYLTILSNGTGLFSLRFFDEGLATLNIEYLNTSKENETVIIILSIKILVSLKIFSLLEFLAGSRALNRDRIEIEIKALAGTASYQARTCFKIRAYG